jgi:hypothetical protein
MVRPRIIERDLERDKRKREAMPTRYIGKYDEGELKEFPTAGLRELLAR